jgi:predicted ATP-grasp superfamily ATP-dependent carboligase
MGVILTRRLNLQSEFLSFIHYFDMKTKLDIGKAGKSRVVILGMAHHPRIVGAIQSLGRAGIQVLAVDCKPPAHGGYSRYLKERFLIEPGSDNALNFLESLGETGGGVLMPANDDYLIMVAKNFQRLSRHFILTTPPWDTLEKAMDISKCYTIARSIGLKTPEFFKPRDEQDMKTVVKKLDVENHHYLLKTMPGSEPAELSNERHTKLGGLTRSLIEANCREIFSRLGEFPTIVQVVPGEADQCIGVSLVVDSDHRPILSYCVKRLKLYTYSRNHTYSTGELAHPYELGANVYCESTRDDEATDAAARMVRAMGYVGAITLEFRRNLSDNSLTLIKCDPRFVRATGLSKALGLDMTMAVYKIFTKESVQMPEHYPEGVAWIWFSQYLEALWNNRDNFAVRKELFSLAKEFRRIKAYAFLDSSDPVPFFADFAWCGREWMKLRLRGLSRRWDHRPSTASRY